MKDIPLLDYFQWKLQCEYLSDLHWLGNTQRARLMQEVERLSAADASLREWNDALEYLLGQSQQLTVEAARDALLIGLKVQNKPKSDCHGEPTENQVAAAVFADGTASTSSLR